MDLGAVLVELHLIHQLVDQKNSAAVIGKKILAHGAAGNRAGIESRPGIAHNDQHAAVLVARHQALDDFAGVFLGAVHHGVGQRFLQGEFDGVFLAVSAVHLPDSLHHLFHYRVHGLAVGRERDADAQIQFFRIEVVLRELFLGRSSRFHGGWFVLICPELGLSGF